MNFIKRFSGNPILSSEDIPYESSLVFNPGVTKFNNEYVMIFRNDYGVKETNFSDPGSFKVRLGFAKSKDGIKWDIDPHKNILSDWLSEEITHITDPRLTVIDGRCYLSAALATKHGLRAGIAVTDDFENFEMLSMTVPDNRNIVLFPEKINGKFVRLERPFPVYSRNGKDKFDIWMSDSPDCKYWGNSELLLPVEKVPFANNKLGPASPPVKTERGWLALFHAVDLDELRGKNGWEEKWQKRYTVGVMLLDKDNPHKIIGISREPLMIPEADYETSKGYRWNVLFPCGMILEESGELKIYYGASDAFICLAFAHISYLLSRCNPC